MVGRRWSAFPAVVCSLAPLATAFACVTFAVRSMQVNGYDHCRRQNCPGGHVGPEVQPLLWFNPPAPFHPQMLNRSALFNTPLEPQAAAASVSSHQAAAAPDSAPPSLPLRLPQLAATVEPNAAAVSTTPPLSLPSSFL